ncbi:hypothetical protein AB0C96_10095 [Streptomyces sp. NPDC048506]|uniref:hypothetical protein n=1 Tax=Streptomyces sp. NPDC048506 TaxID=3155028 RepID=UPI0034272CAB
MADDRYNWLDKDTSERLLRGEPVSARHGDGARELEQLLEAAAAVAARSPEAAPLTGEEAAVAAFHRAGAGAATRGRSADPLATLHGADFAERPRLARPFRRGFAVALAACAIGGVAVAAGTGVLPGPFRGNGGDPEPGSSVSAAETPGPFETGRPGAQTEGTTAQTPDATHDGRTGKPSGTPTPGSSPGVTHGPGRPGEGKGRGDGDDNGGHGDKKKFLLNLCQSYESGKSGQMDRDALRRLEQKAGGSEKVHAFCRAYIARYQTGGGSGDNDGFIGGTGDGKGSGDSGRSGGGSGGDQEDGQPVQSPTTAPTPGASMPAPVSSVTSTDPRAVTPSTTSSSTV